MIEITKVDVWGFGGAIRGMRNPYMSHEKSDSMFKDEFYFSIGEKDMELAKKLIKSGSEHRKFLRMIHVQADILAPRYWWAEMDTYKHVTMNSSSTMHLIVKSPLNSGDFSLDDSRANSLVFDELLKGLNVNIRCYCTAKTKDVKEEYFRTIKQLLPESYNQLRTIDTNYECLLSIYHQRRNHRLSEWHTFCEWIESLPYMEDFLNAMD